MRQVLNHWLQATRRKRSLAEREEELNRAVLSQAYDKWRDKFLENNLRPAVRFCILVPLEVSHFKDIKELDVLLQSQTNLLFKMFRIWEARTPVSSLQMLCGNREDNSVLLVDSSYSVSRSPYPRKCVAEVEGSHARRDETETSTRSRPFRSTRSVSLFTYQELSH
jgi:hypothetical protein